MNKSLILIDNFFDKNKINMIQKQYPDAKILAINYKTHKFLEKSNISHELGDEYLSDDDKKSIDHKSIEFSKNWYREKNIKNFLNFKNYDLPNFLELEFLVYFLEILKTTTVILNILKKEKPTNVINLTQFNDYISKFCDIHGINSINYKNENQNQLHYDQINLKFNLGKLPISFNITRTKFLKIKKFFEKIVYGVYDLKLKSNSFNLESILLLDFNPVIYENLFLELSKINKNILLLNQRRPAIWNLKSLNIVKNSKCKIINLENFQKYLTVEQIDESKTFLTNLNKIWKMDNIFENLFQNNGITFWHSIKSYFIQTCNDRFSESINRILLLEKLFQNVSIVNILEWAETGQEEKEVLTLAKNMKINSIMLQHAMYSTASIWKDFGRFLARFTHPLMSDQQAVWGELTKNFAISNGYAPEKILKVGSPRHDNFFNFKTKSPKTGFVLLATTGASGIFTEGSTTDVYIKFDNFIKEVCRVMKKFPEKKLIVKPHPQSDFINNITELIKEIDPKITIIYDTDLPKLISMCDAVISFNTSTILLESIIMNKPSIDLQIENWSKENEITKMNAVYSIDNISDIENGLRKILYDENTKKELSENSKIFLEQFIHNPGNASKILAQFLDKS